MCVPTISTTEHTDDHFTISITLATMNCSVIYCWLLFGLFVNLWLPIECDSFGYDNHDDHDQDSISDDDDEFGDDLIDYSTDYSTEHHHPPVLYPPFKQKKSILTSEKLFDYLNSVQSQVLKNDDVLTIKDRNHHHHNQFESPDNWKSTTTTTTSTTPTTTTTVKPNILGKQLDFSASPESEIQSDQPFTAADFYNVNYNNRNNAVTHRTNPDKYLLLANNINSDNNPIQNPTYSDIPKAWRCQLDARQDCGLVNDQNVGQYFKLKNHNFVDTGHYQWQLWYLMLNSSEMPPNVAGARLITPYFENKKIYTGCLRFEYVTVGRQFEKMVVYQQDQENHCIWSSEVQSESSDKPSTEIVNLSIDLRKGDPRFFIEAYKTNRRLSKPSILALSEFSFEYRPCSFNNANQCRPPPPPQRNPNESNVVIP